MIGTLHLIDELEAALSSGTSRRRVEMLTRITELFISGAPRYSDEQIGVFDAIMVRLMRTIDATARAKLASRLAPITNAPANLIRMLAFDEDIAVAGPVLSQSEQLDERALLANAGSKSQQRLAALARRRSLSEAVTTVLVERGDRDVVRALAGNAGARFSDPGFRMLVKRSTADDDLAAVAGARTDIPCQHPLELPDGASMAVRPRLAAEDQRARPSIDGVAAEVAGSIGDEARSASPDFATARAAAERQNRIPGIGEAAIYQYASDRKFEETAVALSQLSDMPLDVVERALGEPGAEIILILAKVAGLSATTTKAMLRLRAAERGMSANDLDHALSTFNQLQPDTARRVLGFFRTRVKKSPEPPGAPTAPLSS